MQGCGQTPHSGNFVWSDSHCHWHINQFNNYSLVQATDKQAAAGLKQAFCLEDFSQWDPNSGGRVYDCGNQGVTPGWEDVYSASLPCQFINVDGVASGDYRLVATTNALPTVTEANIHNNTTVVPLHISGNTVTSASQGWQPRETLTAAPLAQPSIASWGPNRIDAFWTDGRLNHRAKDHDSWKATDSFTSPSGVSFRTAPASVSWAPNRIDAFVRGSDNKLWHQWYDGAWHSWDNANGVTGLASAPAVISWGPNALDIFWIDASGNLQHTFYDSGWGYIENLGNPGVALVQDPRAVAWGVGRLDVVVRGADNRLWHAAWDGAWSNWDNPNGVATVTGRPEVVSWGPGVLDIFWPNSASHNLQHTYWDNGWGPVDNLGVTGGAQIDNTPTVAAWGPNRLDAFVKGSDKRLYHIYWDGSSFSWDLPIQNTDVTGDPIATSWGSSELSILFGVTPSSGKGLGSVSWL